MSTTNEHSGAVAYPEIWNVAEFAIRCVLQTITRDRRLGPRHDARQTLKSFQLYAGTHVAFARSYLYPAAVLRASFVVFIVSHLSPFLSVAWTLSNGTATCFSPTPRKPPDLSVRIHQDIADLADLRIRRIIDVLFVPVRHGRSVRRQS